MNDDKKPFQSYAEGSFAALFATAIEPYQKRIERLTEGNKILRERVKALEVGILEVKRKTSEVKKVIHKKEPRMKKNAKFSDTHESYVEIIDYIRDNFKNVSVVSKEKIIAGTNLSRQDIRMELSTRFDSRLLSEMFLPDRAVTNLIIAAGLDGRSKPVVMLVEGKDTKYAILMMDRKKKD